MPGGRTQPGARRRAGVTALGLQHALRRSPARGHVHRQREHAHRLVHFIELTNNHEEQHLP